MTVDLAICLLPKRRTFQATSTGVAAIVEGLRGSGWLSSTEGRSLRRGDGRDGVALPTPMTAASAAALRRPTALEALDDEYRLTFEASWDEPELISRKILNDDDDAPPQGYDVHLAVARDLWFFWANNVEAPFTFPCVCGQELAYETRASRVAPSFASGRVRAVCSVCGAACDPTAQPRISVRSDTQWERGSLAHPVDVPYAPLVAHSVLIVDFSNDWPRLPRGKSLALDARLLALCESAFNEPFESVKLFM